MSERAMSDEVAAFEVWADRQPITKSERAIAWMAWQVATRATAERCAVACEGVTWPDSKTWASDFAALCRKVGEA